MRKKIIEYMWKEEETKMLKRKLNKSSKEYVSE